MNFWERSSNNCRVSFPDSPRGGDSCVVVNDDMGIHIAANLVRIRSISHVGTKCAWGYIFFGRNESGACLKDNILIVAETRQYFMYVCVKTYFLMPTYSMEESVSLVTPTAQASLDILLPEYCLKKVWYKAHHWNTCRMHPREAVGLTMNHEPMRR